MQQPTDRKRAHAVDPTQNAVTAMHPSQAKNVLKVKKKTIFKCLFVLIKQLRMVLFKLLMPDGEAQKANITSNAPEKVFKFIYIWLWRWICRGVLAMPVL